MNEKENANDINLDIVDNSINLDIDTQNNLKEILRAINELQGRLALIVRTYAKAKGETGNYSISNDVTQLIKQQ